MTIAVYFSAVVLGESPCLRESSRTNSQVLVLILVIGGGAYWARLAIARPLSPNGQAAAKSVVTGCIL